MNAFANRYHFHPGSSIEHLTFLLTVTSSRFQPQSCGTWSTKPGSQRSVNSKKRNEENKYNMHQNTTTYDNIFKNKPAENTFLFSLVCWLLSHRHKKNIEKRIERVLKNAQEKRMEQVLLRTGGLHNK